ncbi:hypothetical protein ACFQZT_24680 [Paenibacillus sp. GCM10027628]|uniref:hypothetical protein n=1 Tax=Paenibacillus sp. GCM10027628 TaxID=3273413 RepID=UPI00362A84DB
MIQEETTHKNKFIALIWSIAMPGLGHLYLGNKIIGLAFMVYSVLFLIRAKLNSIIFYVFSGNFKKANLLFMENPTLFFPAAYSFAMWHAFNYSVIARKGNPLEYKLTGFFFGLIIGGVPGSSQKFLGTYIITGLVTGIVTGVLFHFIEKLIMFIVKRRLR